MTSYSTSAGPLPRRGLRERIDLRSAGMLLAFVAIAFAVAALGAVTTISAVDGWYARAPHVPWTPPNWSFGVVWTVLYLTIGISGWLVWRERWRTPVAPALTFFVAQLVLNALWTPVFFGAYALIGPTALWLALAIIVVLDLAVGATMAAFWPVSRAASLLLVPYFAWILYASTLNWGDAALIALG